MMMTSYRNRVYIDFETRSELDLKTTNTFEYTVHPSTDVLCLAVVYYDFGLGEWVKKVYDNFEIACGLDITFMPDSILVAHNAYFERMVWQNIMNRYGYPDIPVNLWRCTMAKSYAANVGGSLDKVARILGLEHQKDNVGKTAMYRMMKKKAPSKRDPSEWEGSASVWKTLMEYCLQDVLVEKEIDEILPDLSPDEQKVWELDQKINDTGFCADRETAIRLRGMAKYVAPILNKQMQEITDNLVPSANTVGKMLAFVQQYHPEIKDMQKQTVLDALHSPRLNPRVREVLEIRKQLGKSSVAKIKTLLNHSEFDGRIRGSLQYHGASTGRWAGRGVQPQNLPKPEKGMKNAINEELKSNDPLLLQKISSSIRGLIVPSEGMDLYVADFASIEARVLFWLACEEIGLEAYYEKKDIYVEMAKVIYKTQDIDDAKRALGKQAVLGCGFQMGWERFISTCAGYGIEVSEKLSKETVDAYRGLYLKVKAFWYNLQNAAKEAVNTGKCVAVGRIKFQMWREWLCVELPSGRILYYYKPQINLTSTKVGDKMVLSYLGYKDGCLNPKRIGMYGGKWAENITQATARDAMVLSMFGCLKAGYRMLITVHDEILTEKANGSLEEFDEAMLRPTRVSKWLQGCPIGIESKKLRRYEK